MSSVNTCLTTPRSGRSPETDSDWVRHRKEWVGGGEAMDGGINE